MFFAYHEPEALREESCCGNAGTSTTQKSEVAVANQTKGSGVCEISGKDSKVLEKDSRTCFANPLSWASSTGFPIQKGFENSEVFWSASPKVCDPHCLWLAGPLLKRTMLKVRLPQWKRESHSWPCSTAATSCVCISHFNALPWVESPSDKPTPGKVLK